MSKLNKIDNILKNAKVVNEDGTEHKSTILEKIDDWCFEHLWLYGYGYRIWKEYLCPKAISRMIKFFFQRRIRGFDDSETWDLDTQFYKWLEPRLRRFLEISLAYPTDYDNPSSWKKELQKRVNQLEVINNVNEFDYDNWIHIPPKELEKLKRKGCTKATINSVAFDYLIKDFNKWFANNIQKLWW